MQKVYKTIKTGNNISKSSEDLIEYILSISSYEAKLEVTIKSNKTTNKYVLEQYYLEPYYSKQIVKEPKNIENLEIIYNGRIYCRPAVRLRFYSDVRSCRHEQNRHCFPLRPVKTEYRDRHKGQR